MTTRKKTILVTGSSSGNGRAAAKLFAARGWNVIATMRSPERETELGKIEGIAVDVLDVTKAEHVRAAAEKFGARTDVVLNNAGYGVVGPLEGMTDEQMVREFDVNLMGAVRITRAFLPYFRERRSGLFINITSVGGVVALPFSSSYFATKWAIQGWSEVISFEVAPFGIGVKTVLPGGVDTNFFNVMEVAHHPAYEARSNPVIASFTDPKTKAHYSSPAQVAEVVYEAATDGKDQLMYFAGEDAKGWFAMRRQIGDEAFRQKMAGGVFQGA
jgi:NAD(P)-dependent dehydrogenase (short-subunit alcohol dehydrogenase family)